MLDESLEPRRTFLSLSLSVAQVLRSSIYYLFISIVKVYLGVGKREEKEARRSAV